MAEKSIQLEKIAEISWKTDDVFQIFKFSNFQKIKFQFEKQRRTNFAIFSLSDSYSCTRLSAETEPRQQDRQ